jgi:bifunctional UDP-N-acetylglucosamine pyrophosphorylase/glucosamine-1-phosphate N-acetyltransferase
MKLEIVILAAGQGTRMKSNLPKVLHQVAGKSLLEHHVVVGHGSGQVREALSAYELNWVTQEQQLGTGHAVMQALPDISPDSLVLVLYGDVPLTSRETLQALVGQAGDSPALLTAVLADPAGYGRILRDGNGALLGVVEDRDASQEQRAICEINTGVLAAPARDLQAYLPRVDNDNGQGEYYLPDVLKLAVVEGKQVATSQAESELEILGVNDRVQLNQVEREYQRRQAEQLMRQGVSVADAARLDIRGEVVCGEDVSIDVNVVFEGSVTLGNGVTIGPNCVLRTAVRESGISSRPRKPI